MHYAPSVDAETAVSALVNDRPEWIPVLEAACAVSDRVEAFGGEFAGAWVIDELERRTGRRTWLPNMRLLVSYGLIEKVGESSRGGRRAYYRFSAKQSIKNALVRIGAGGDSGEPRSKGVRRFHFIAAGDSGESGSDWARRSADIEYEPRPWR
jgi:hypothetical protein